jgi:hypothetical protein
VRDRGTLYHQPHMDTDIVMLEIDPDWLANMFRCEICGTTEGRIRTATMDDGGPTCLDCAAATNGP